jgi:prefoldin alpha subunit
LKTVEDAKAYYQRKVDFVKASTRNLTQTIASKQSARQSVQELMQYKMAMAAQEQQQQAAVASS